MRKLLCALLFAAVTAPGGAQTSPGPSLTLDEALRLARQNNPLYLQAINGRRRAETALRSAYGTLLPSATTSLGSGYRQGKPQFFQGVAFGANSDVLSSSWGLNLNYSVNPGALAALRAEQALLDAAEYDVTGADQTLK